MLKDWKGLTIHYSELPASQPGSANAEEWETYRREVSRLLQDGHEGKWVLIKHSNIIGLFDDNGSALREGYRRYQQDGFLIHQVQIREPLIRLSHRASACLTLRSALRQPA